MQTAKCVDASNIPTHILTKDQSYRIIGINNGYVAFIGNNGKKYTYPLKRFKVDSKETLK